MINPILAADVIGIALILACFVMYYALACSRSSGVLGPYVAAVLKNLLGVGAYIVPALAGLLGVIVMVGPLEIIP
ncbi:MAG: hypothetical protein ACP5R5_03730, partial [Armatimonadota bacterium]